MPESDASSSPRIEGQLAGPRELRHVAAMQTCDQVQRRRRCYHVVGLQVVEEGPPDVEGTTTDRDGDGFADEADNCPSNANPSQLDTNGTALPSINRPHAEGAGGEVARRNGWVSSSN